MEQKNNKTKKNNAKIKIRVMYALMGLCLALAAAFGAAIAIEIFTDSQGSAFYAEIPVNYKPRQTVTAAPADPNAELMNENGNADDTDYEHVSFIDFASMRELYPDIIGWLQSEGTVINYPVVQTDNNDFYLSHLPDKSRNKLGSIFCDYRNAPDFSGQNIFIYGHHMESGNLFGSLKYYADQSYYERYPTMFLFTPAADYTIVLVAGYVLDSAYESPPSGFADQAALDSYLTEIKNRSVFKSGVSVELGDQIVFLCTCTPSRIRSSASERFVLVGKLVEN